MWSDNDMGREVYVFSEHAVGYITGFNFDDNTYFIDLYHDGSTLECERDDFRVMREGDNVWSIKEEKE